MQGYASARLRRGRSPGSDGRPASSVRWLEQLDRDRGSLEKLARDLDRRPLDLADAGPRLLDTVHRQLMLQVGVRFPDAHARTRSGLAYVKGACASEAGEFDHARSWLTRAFALADRTHPALLCRIGLELAQIHLMHGERIAADAVLAELEAIDGDGAHLSCDRLLVDALLRKDVGDHRSTLPLYRAALARASNALTPFSRVLCLMNLAVAVEHADPREAGALCRLALATVESEELTPHVRPNLWNILGYTLICTGDLSAARAALSTARDEARSLGTRLFELRARFNLAIADEVEGRGREAADELAAIEREALIPATTHLRLWAAIRRAWIALDRSEAAPAREIVNTVGAARPYWEALDTLRARLALLSGDLETARARFETLLASYREKDDMLTVMVLLLWIAHVEHIAGRRGRARRRLTDAHEIAIRSGFGASPNWWSGDIVRSASEIAEGTELAGWARSMCSFAPAASGVLTPAIEIGRDGSVSVDGKTLDGRRWRSGGTGSGVLRRYFRLLASAHPRALKRDELADALWPDSDGDRAISNVYSATSDLRRVLHGLNGVRVVCEEGTYMLHLGSNVAVTTKTPA